MKSFITTNPTSIRKKPTLLDLFCGAGGASVGYDRAGFDVTGVDIRPQPNYPFKFIEGDAAEFLRKHGSEYDVIHASPPCQGYSKHTRPNSKHVHYSKGSDEPRLIGTIRELIPKNKLYIIENVVGARDNLIKPITLCGTMFNLPIARHRLFEVNFKFEPPVHPKCRGVAKKYSIDNNIEYRVMSVCGKTRGRGCVDTWKKLTGNQWMIRGHELSESIPWVYTKSIGTALMAQLNLATDEENNDLIVSPGEDMNVFKKENKLLRQENKLLQQENGLLRQKIMELENRLVDYVCYQCGEEYDKSESLGECGTCENALCDNCYDNIHSCYECNQDTCERCINKYCEICANCFCISCPQHDCTETDNQ